MNTLYTIIALFSLGAIVGLYLLVLVLQKKETPKFVSFIHGAFVASALVMLITYSLKTTPGPIEAVVLFVMAALGGVVLIYKDVTKQPMPRWLAIGHGLVAVLGFVFLLVYTFGY